MDALRAAGLAGLAVRLALIAYGSWQDANFVLKYTDVDYHVFSDAAAAVVAGGSPYDRATYRYSPLLAWALVPNMLVHRAFGKVLFALCDLAVAALTARLLRHAGKPRKEVLLWTAAWLFNPLSINISTRGNADSITCLVLLLTAQALLERRTIAGAMAYGLAVHLRIFPIFFVPSILLFMDDVYAGHAGPPRPWYLQGLRQRVVFGVVSGGLFLALGAAGFALYGWPFLDETYLYHLTRTDNRHNFSVYFYALYLHYGMPLGLWTGLVSFVPGILVHVALAVAFHRDIVFCMCLQTMAFVAFNKVFTAQYFVWYAGLLPVALANVRLRLIGLGGVLLASWLAAELNWLFWAYRLEFLGENTFLQLWLSGLAFFCVNVAIIAALALRHEPSNEGKDKLA